MAVIKDRIKAIVPAERRVAIRRLLARVKVLSSYGYDARRFLEASSAGRAADDEERLAAHITMDYHRLEKGMALPSPRFGFGREAVLRLMRSIGRYEERYGPSDVTEFGRDGAGRLSSFQPGQYARPGRGDRPVPGARAGVRGLSRHRCRHSIRCFHSLATPPSDS